MSSLSTATLPSLLAFGPQTEYPPEVVLQSYRQELNSNPQLSLLREAVDQLPQFWRQLVDLDPSLSKVPGTEYLGHLKHWVRVGGALLHLNDKPHNHYGLAVTVLLQIVQYTQYLCRFGKHAHRKVLDSVRVGGIQGHCIGFLSAVAVASAASETDISSFAAIALRLAVCIGAYVDKGSTCAQIPVEHVAVAVRWNETDVSGKADVSKIIQSIPNAYVSSINDDASVTVTIKATDLADLVDKARKHNLRTKTVHVYGRFHTTDHSDVLNQLTRTALQSLKLELPDAKQLQVPVRNNANGQVITGGSLSLLVLESILVNTTDWYLTLRSSIQRLPQSSRMIAVAGFGNCIPASIAQTSGLQILALNHSQTSALNTEEVLSSDYSDNGSSTTNNDFVGSLIDGIGSIDEVSDAHDLTKYPPHSIAVVGMAGRFPGADSVDELWDLIMEGKSTVEPAPVERLGLPQTGDNAKTKWWGNFLKDSDAFDHKFFKKSSREALAWDPQQRILLEVVYEALESAGYFGAANVSEPLDYGCYIGAVMNNYYDNLSCHPATAYALVGTSRSYLSGCMSHHFGWTGPSLTIDTACSSSLVAINTACRAIWSGECSRAIAGGTNVISSPFDYQNLAAAGFLSPSGQCKPFDANADGYCRGEAVAVVVLKPLLDAVAENDNVLGVIVGSAVNQNHHCGQITTPDSASQVGLYQKVMKYSGVKPESVSYVEAHGTGTSVGDPIEVRSIRDAFCEPQRDSALHLSSIKGNIGHTEATAGVTGLIKVLLMMRHRKMAKQASLEVLNPKISVSDQEQMVIPRDTLEWKASSLLALVNSYGAAGSNAAVMVREKPTPRISSTPVQLSRYPLFISAGSVAGLSRYSKKLLYWLRNAETRPGLNLLESLTFNLADRGNHLLSHVLAISASSIQDLEIKLEAAITGSGIVSPAREQKPVVLVFGGQESEFVGLSRDIYRSSKVLSKHLDAVNDLLVSTGAGSLYPFVFETKPTTDIVALHTALFAIQYASAKAWMDCGLKVSAVVGHSFGQLTALCISGALSLPDTLKLIAGRASLMQKYWGPDPGSMVFVQSSRQEVEEMLRVLTLKRRDFYAEIACYNGPESHVVVGTTESVESLQRHITNTPSLQHFVRTKKLKVTNGFHSQFTEPLLPHLASLAQQLDWMRPTIHLEITSEFESDSAPDFGIVAEHTRKPVFFQQAIKRLTARLQHCTWIEAGRGSSVMQLVKASVPNPQAHAFYSPQLASPTKGQESLTDIAVDLWKGGYAIQYWPFHRCQKSDYEHLRLPPIQFEKTRHWLGYKRRNVENNDSKSRNMTAMEETHKLLTFINFRDGSNNEAIFRIDPEADRFQQILSGHIVAGQNLAPASLCFEVVARAALFLENDTQVATYVPTVDDLHMKSPIGQNTTKNISLVLDRLSDKHPSWSFSIVTQDRGSPMSTPLEHATGRVCLKKHDDTRSVRDFTRFETLIGYRRYKEIVEHPDAETMQGNHIYRAFNTIVCYGEAFRGIKQIANVGLEAAGKVRIPLTYDDPVDQRLCNTSMTDSFMQFAGFLVNYFNNPSMEDVFVCTKIEHIEIGGAFDPNAKEWLVYSTMNEGSGNDAASDVYVFDARTNKMVMAAFGIIFTKTSHGLLGRMLKNVNKPVTKTRVLTRDEQLADTAPITPARLIAPIDVTITARKPTSKRQEILQLFSNVTDLPIEELKDNLALEDLGIDSLMATEVLNDIRSTFGIAIDLSSFLFFDNLQAIISHINEKLGLDGSEAEHDRDSASTRTIVSEVYSEMMNSVSLTPATECDLTFFEPEASVEGPNSLHQPPTIISAISAFEETRLNYDRLAMTNQAIGFWKEAYPHQARLVLAYVVETFAELGCDLRNLKSGDDLPQVNTLNKHTELVRQLHHVLEEGNLIVSKDRNSFSRTDVAVDSTSAESVYHQIVDLYPQHASVNKLVRAVGSEMAACLRGDKTALQVIFGKRDTKKTLEEMYEFWPLSRTPTLVLGDFLTKALTTNVTRGGKFRILEVGAGTGSATRYIVDHLKSQGIDFEYVFTDLSASLVNAAAKQFKSAGGMKFEALDIEQTPKPEYVGAFHCVIASNCIHATRNLDVSLRNIRQMLREDGFLTLIEITKNMFWLDIVFGLFEGWWLFEDGRQHALVNEKQWERRLKTAGFQDVSWSDGDTPESKTIRVIAAFPACGNVTSEKTVKAAFETVVYKEIGDLEIHADIYYPAESEVLPQKKMPVALMIHGGSHILFSRKDIRPAQTRLLLAKGFLPVSLDYRLCPETPLLDGAMVDVCDALDWARNKLPSIPLRRSGLQIDGERVVVVGWSSGGQLAMSLAWTAPQRGLRPPESNLIFYAPTDYEDSWWQHPIQPNGAVYKGQQYDLLEGVRSEPITSYSILGAWENPISDPHSQNDPRCRIVLHNNWKAQTLPVILTGLPSKEKAAAEYPEITDWHTLSQPSPDLIRAASPRAHVVDGTYRMPTFFVHGTADDLIPWQQSQGTYEAMAKRGIDAELVLVDGAPHICDLSGDVESEGWKAVLRGYDFLCSHV